MRIAALALIATACCRRAVPIAADPATDTALLDVVRADADAADEPERPFDGLAASLALGPYPSLEAACDALLDKCEPLYSECSCWGPRDTAAVGWLHVEGAEVSANAPGGPNDETATRHALIPTKAGLWLARDGVRAGRMWAINGDGYWRHTVRSASLRIVDSSRVVGEARVDEATCFCCGSAHPNCAGQKGTLSPGFPIDYVLECRRDARDRPWCFVAATSPRPAPKTRDLAIVGDELETIESWSDVGPRRRRIWFP
jgi:hypothetical protein